MAIESQCMRALVSFLIRWQDSQAVDFFQEEAIMEFASWKALLKFSILQQVFPYVLRNVRFLGIIQVPCHLIRFSFFSMARYTCLGGAKSWEIFLNPEDACRVLSDSQG